MLDTDPTLTPNRVFVVHCDHCQTVNHKCGWEFKAAGRDHPARTQCWKCDAWFDPNWERDLEISSQVARDEIRQERFAA